MNRTDRFDDLISDWLHADAEHRVPEHLDAVLRRTRTERQHPAWSSLQRWFPMDMVATGRGTNLRPIAALLVIGTVIAAVLGVAYVASQPKPQFVSGLAANGRVFVATET